MKRNNALACLLVIAAITVAAIAGCVAPSAPDNTSSNTSPAGTAAATTLHNPWVTKAGAYRGALHTHTTHSDGALSPEQLTAAYAREGFAFIFITDHDTVTRSPAASGMLVLPGEEIATCVKCPPRTDADRAGHIVGLNLTAAVASQQPPQRVIGDINAQGGMALLAHPTLPVSGLGFTNETLRNLTGYRFVEVTNLDAPGALAFYDTALSRGTQAWLVGDDDAHTFHEVNATASVVVNADRLTAADVLTNLRAGNFYVTTGHGLTAAPGAARISSITTSNRTIAITVPEPSTVTWIQKGGAVLKTTDGVTRDEYTVRGDERYVRIVVTPRAYPAQHAWSQPIAVEQRL
ncbi:MAG: CehA/McbA family metallohydrolase [Halobacteriota archaeon]